MTYLCLPCGGLQANCYVLYDEHNNAVVIDPGDGAQQILQVIRTHDLCVKAILLTHAHFDHMMAADAVKAQTGAPLMLHQADVPALTDPKRSLMPYPCALSADRVLCDGDVVRVGSLEFRVIHTPGHTPGGVCYHCEDILFCGDTLFCDGCGRTDLPGGDVEQLCSSLRLLGSLPKHWRIAPGHGEESTIGEEVRKYPLLMGL